MNNQQSYSNDNRAQNGYQQNDNYSNGPDNSNSMPPPVYEGHHYENLPPQQNIETKNTPPREFLPGHHVYGKKSGIYFVCDISRSNNHTMAIEGADSTGPKAYNWTTKTRVQLTANELPVVSAVFCGLLKECEFKNHGVGSNKGFTIKNQGNSFFCSIYEKGKPIKATPIFAEDGFHVRNLLLMQLQKANPGLSADMLLHSLKVLAKQKTQS